VHTGTPKPPPRPSLGQCCYFSFLRPSHGRVVIPLPWQFLPPDGQAALPSPVCRCKVKLSHKHLFPLVGDSLPTLPSTKCHCTGRDSPRQPIPPAGSAGPLLSFPPSVLRRGAGQQDTKPSFWGIPQLSFTVPRLPSQRPLCQRVPVRSRRDGRPKLVAGDAALQAWPFESAQGLIPLVWTPAWWPCCTAVSQTPPRSWRFQQGCLSPELCQTRLWQLPRSWAMVGKGSEEPKSG